MRKLNYLLTSNPEVDFKWTKPPNSVFFSKLQMWKIPRYFGDTLSIKFCYNKLQMKSYVYGCLYHVLVPWQVAWYSDVNTRVSFPVSRRIVLLMKLELKRITICSWWQQNCNASSLWKRRATKKPENAPNLYIRPRQPQGIFSCNFFYWSARVRGDLIFKTVKLFVLSLTNNLTPSSESNEEVFRSGCWNISLQLWQSLSGLPLPARSHSNKIWYNKWPFEET